MMTARSPTISILLAVLLTAGFLAARTATAEWYVAGQFGANFADQLSDIRGTGSLSGFRAPDFDLQNSFVYGGKLGMFPGNGWFGLELDVFNSTPHIKNLDNVPGIHMGDKRGSEFAGTVSWRDIPTLCRDRGRCGHCANRGLRNYPGQY